MSPNDSDSDSHSSSRHFGRRRIKPRNQRSSNFEDDFESDATSGIGEDQALLLVNRQRGFEGEDELQLEANFQVLDEVLETCHDKPICVIAVTGAVRSGRSFLLNTFIERLQRLENRTSRRQRKRNKHYKGFGFKSGNEPVTKGVWIWNRAFCVPGEEDDVAVLLVDVEGIDPEVSKPDEIEAWLALPLLISSTLIFNTVGDLSPSEFGFLSPLLERGCPENYPKLSFLVRDWTDTHNHPYGNGKRYLDSDSVTDNFFTKARSQYKYYDCFLLPHIGESSIVNTFNGSDEDIGSEFLGNLENYLDTLLSDRHLRAKSIFGKTVTPAQFRYFFEKFVELINKSFANQTALASVPFWSFFEKAGEKWKFENGVKMYEQHLAKSKATGPAGYAHPTIMDGIHKQAQRKALEAFSSFDLSSSKEQQLKEKFLHKIHQLNEDFKAKSMSMQQSKIEDKIKSACETLRKELSSKLSFTCSENPSLESAMVFYETEFVEETAQEATMKIRRDFVQEFPEVNSERQQSLVANLNTKMQSIVGTFRDKNMENRDRAYERADKAVEKLKTEYVAGIKATIAIRPNIDVSLLEDLHFVQTQKLELKFSGIKIGTPEFTQTTFDRLMSEVNEEYQNIISELSPPKNQYDNEINVEAEKYKATLTSQNFVHVSQLDRFHQDSVKKVVQKFLVTNKVKTELDKVANQLTMQLDLVYESLKPSIQSSRKSSFRTSHYDEDIDTILSGLLTDHESSILDITASAKSPEKLLEKHDYLRQQAEQSLRTQLQHNPEMYRQAFQKLQQGLQENYRNVQSSFVEKKETEDVALREAKFEATQAYQNDMKFFFDQNKNAYFGDAELSETSQKLISKIMTRIDRMFDLNASQRNAVEQSLSDLAKRYKEQNEVIKHTHIGEDLAIGIDLGTTYCCVAVFHKGKVEVLRNEQGENTTPSFVCIHKGGETEVGSGAKNKSFRNPDNTIFDAKRIIGRPITDPNLIEDMKFWPFKVVEKDNTPQIVVHGEHYFPQEISGFLLKHLKEEAEKTLNKKITKAVITVPAYFSDGQRQATIDAGEMAGLEVLGILNEPTAAALAFRQECFDVGTSRKILVYDFGGGTFDVSILAISDIKLEVLGIAGDSHLGGEDLDKNMMAYCGKEFQTETGIDIFEGKDDPNQYTSGKVKRNLNRLQKECEKIKKGLASTRSASAMTQVSIDGFVDGEDLVVDINRNNFDELNKRLYQRTLEITDKALNSAGLSTDDIDDVVMVGGSTRIKKVQEMLSKHFGDKALNTRLNPDEAVAYGAAVQAALLNSKPGSKPFDFGKIQEVTSMSYGIELGDKTMDVLIPKSTKIPISHTEEYKTFKDNQTSVVIPIYQGDDRSTQNNIFLGTFSLDGIPPGPAGTESIDVTMKIDLNGTLSVEAVCRSTKGKRSLVVTDDRAKMPTERKNRYLAEAPEYH